MDIGIYKGAASLAAYEKWQEAISQNIAASSVPGFKKTEMDFTAMDSDTTKLRTGSKFSDVMQGVMPQATARINYSQGALRNSGSDLDFAIQGSGFFQVQRADGTTGYTRDGEFHISADKTLVTKQGLPVMGESGPINFKTGSGPITINAEGTIAQADQAVGKLSVYNFPDTDKLRRIGDGMLAPSDPTITPERVEKPEVLNGFLEGSNVSSLSEMVNLITVSRAYEASQKIIQSQDDSMGKAIQTLGNPSA